MSDDTTILPNGTTGFHSHNSGGRHDHEGLRELLISQQIANESRVATKSIYDAGNCSRDAIERHIITNKDDAERVQRNIDLVRLETVKQFNELENRVFRETSEIKSLIVHIDNERTQRELADAKDEIRFLRQRLTTN